jgi:fumarylacetoacetate (FAA) hydrolase family protein
MSPTLDPATTLPADGTSGTLVGRIWRPDVEGPSVVVAKGDGLHDITRAFPTMRDLCETRNPAQAAKAAASEPAGSLAEILANTPPQARDLRRPWLLAPIDLQAIKAAGVTFVVSMLERVIE